jgi:hypothetical protein
MYQGYLHLKNEANRCYTIFFDKPLIISTNDYFIEVSKDINYFNRYYINTDNISFIDYFEIDENGKPVNK